MLSTKQIKKLLLLINGTSHIEIDGKKLDSWIVNLQDKKEDICFHGEHFDQGAGWEWDFTIDNFRLAKVTDNIITLNDKEGTLCVIALYAIVPKKIELE